MILTRSTTEQLVGTSDSVALSPPRFRILASANRSDNDSGKLGSFSSQVFADFSFRRYKTFFSVTDASGK
jgi:hypothetical protein